MKNIIVRITLSLVLILSLSLLLSSCVDKTVRQINIDFEQMTHNGDTLKDLSGIFDEQTSVGDPYFDKQNIVFPTSRVPLYDADRNGNIDEADKEFTYQITVDLLAEHFVDCVYLFLEDTGHGVTVETGPAFKYDNKIEFTSSNLGWAQIDIGKHTRYINITFTNGKAPSEALVYGYQTGKSVPVNTAEHEYKNFDYFLGINGNINDSKKFTPLTCANYFRDYANWAWFYDPKSYQAGGTNFEGMMVSNHSTVYDILNTDLYKIDPVLCLMYTAGPPTVDGTTNNDPSSYFMYGELLYQTALRFGNNPTSTADMVKVLSLGKKKYNLNCIRWLEAGNEPNGEGNDGFTPYELAALTSCAYDGHNSTVTAMSGSGVGVKNADPNIKLAMAGLAGVGTRYIRSMAFWLENNRADGKVSMDAFNVHTYCKKLVSYNGYQVYVGVCPEIGEITKEVKKLCEWRDKYYPDIEVWMTEFGWDTNTSYETENACHPYANFTAREIQAMWLVRAYFMFAEAGVDRAAMYMAADSGSEATTVGKYLTSGVYTSSGEYKDSFYYLCTLKNNMGDMHFAEVIESGNKNVWIYRFENGEGKSCYAVWCPTMDDIRVDGFKLNIDGDSAVMVEFENKNEQGVKSALTVTDGCVTVNVSERPILVFSE